MDVYGTLRNQVPLTLEATDKPYMSRSFLMYLGLRLVRALWLCGGLGRAIVVLRLLAIKVSCLPRKQLRFEEVNSKDKGLLRSISNNLKEHRHQTKDKAKNNNGFRDLSRAI